MRMLLVSLLLVTTAPVAAHAAWPWGPLAGAPVCTETGSQYATVTCPDGAGGAIVAWNDCRSACGVRAQRIDAMGARAWAGDGVPVVEFAPSGITLAALADGTGGAIIVWKSNTSELAAQRLGPDGALAWPAGGVPLGALVAGFEGYSAFATDGAGGLYAALVRGSATWDCELRVQHVDASGLAEWGDSGLLLSSGGTIRSIAAVPDGAGGVVIAWAENGTLPVPELRAQRISAAGALEWDGGVTVDTLGSVAIGGVSLASAGDGGAFAAWSDQDVSWIARVHAQRLDAAGARQWSPQPVLDLHQDLAVADHHPAALALPGGGLLVGWLAVDGSGLLVAQRLGASGAKLWAPAGVKVSAGVSGVPLSWGNTPRFHVSTDGAEGACFVFMREGWDCSAEQCEVRAARVDGSGVPAWGPVGVVVASGTNGRSWPGLSPAAGGDAIVTYAGDDDVFAQKLHPDGTLGDFPLAATPATPGAAALSVWPNPARGGARFALALPERGRARIEVVDTQGRRVRALLDADVAGGRTEIAWDGRDALGRAAPPGVYFARLRGAGPEVVARFAFVR